ncbi:hypothetical protein BO79DRAFT_208409 [Aspergillus costaricaensis CBS 115574]|uniref:Uncharacterized protein n=1 Tax=Aspergillus costaricaensis CBS 115574 TaxID=1448317 RepID=A0ACD1II24_9EURO|nr:hypothetical protein BO79DRAFT_208409 [Aspergillus costaricaensis CBS 115574]RAK90095.1 hypothetical protein BO79DRAFT_208409 [Aspergillus costaricaensis CBS 115574]
MPDNKTTSSWPVIGCHPFSSFRSLFTSAGKMDKPCTTPTSLSEPLLLNTTTNNTTTTTTITSHQPYSPSQPQQQQQQPDLFASEISKPLLHSPLLSEPETPTENKTASFIWEDINPPAEYYLADKSTSTPPSPPPTYTYSQQDQQQQSPPQDKESDPTMIDTTTRSIPVSSLPGYNDVSGAVIVDYDGFPHFLSPQEEEERKMKLQRAVQEKMLGLPRQTSFEWERPLSAGSAAGWLPRYSPAKRGAQR